MNSPGAHTVLVRQHFDLFEEFSHAAAGWDLDFCQLSRPSGRFYLEQIVGQRAMFSRAFLPSSFYQLGGTMPGYRTVSLLAPGSSFADWRWCGEGVAADSLLVMPQGGEFESMSRHPFDSLHLALSVSLLEEVAQRQFHQPLYEILPEGRVFCAHGGEPILVLRRLLLGISHGPDANAESSVTSLCPDLEEEMAYLVLVCLQGRLLRAPRGPRTQRMRVLASALEWLEACSRTKPGIADIAAGVGVSRRSLEYAFHDGLGVGPSAYLKAHRLAKLNRALMLACPGTSSVSELAREQGFTHMGQLSADYEAMFAERPLATLRRSMVVQATGFSGLTRS